MIWYANEYFDGNSFTDNYVKYKVRIEMKKFITFLALANSFFFIVVDSINAKSVSFLMTIEII